MLIVGSLNKVRFVFAAARITKIPSCSVNTGCYIWCTEK